MCGKSHKMHPYTIIYQREQRVNQTRSSILNNGFGRIILEFQIKSNMNEIQFLITSVGFCNFKEV